MINELNKSHCTCIVAQFPGRLPPSVSPHQWNHFPTNCKSFSRTSVGLVRNIRAPRIRNYPTQSLSSGHTTVPPMHTRRSSSASILRHHHRATSRIHDLCTRFATAITIRWWVHADGETGEDRAFHGSRSSDKDIQGDSVKSGAFYRLEKLWSVRFNCRSQRVEFFNNYAIDVREPYESIVILLHR